MATGTLRSLDADCEDLYTPSSHLMLTSDYCNTV